MFKPRPGQIEVLSYQSGRLGISAVPGSGKTHTLSCLAAQLVADQRLQEGQEVLIVTLVNTAVQNFSSRIAEFILEKGLLPNIGYRVRTLHGLAHDIVRERPDLVGLSDQFSILDEHESIDIIHTIVTNWLPSHPEILESIIKPDLEINPYLRKQWAEYAEQICSDCIRVAKDLQASPQLIRDTLTAMHVDYPVLEMVTDIYAEYQRALAMRSSVDFDDLISLALKILTLDPDFLTRLRWRWPFILEDEAQDSSRLQEEILKTLSGENGNWVRVGDPNQAIFETFTTASPEYLRRFIGLSDVTRCELRFSGRSSPGIIRLANDLTQWGTTLPNEKLKNALDLPLIYPVPPGDPQPNPPENAASILLNEKGFTPENEINFLVNSIKKWIPSHQEETCAVLVPRNDRGMEIAERLDRENIKTVDQLRSSTTTRRIAGVLEAILSSLAEPNHAGKLAEAFTQVMMLLETDQDSPSLEDEKKDGVWISRLRNPESLIRPFVESAGSSVGEMIDESISESVLIFRKKMQRWQLATLLPIDQLILILGQDLFTSISDLALVHKLAISMERTARLQNDWEIPDFVTELHRIVSNERKFLGFDENDTGFDPDKHKGEVVIATIHKAKGLEWDRVYLVSANNYDFPFAQPYDSYIGEKWFVRDQLNLEAETIDRFSALIKKDLAKFFLPEGTATARSREEYSAERLRLFFVGITRARKELCITWNTGRHGEARQSIPFEALRTRWEQFNASAS